MLDFCRHRGPGALQWLSMPYFESQEFHPAPTPLSPSSVTSMVTSMKSFLASSLFVIFTVAPPALAAGGEEALTAVTHKSSINVRSASTEFGVEGLLEFRGQPMQPYAFWFSYLEEPFEIEPGIFLEINPIRQLTTGLFIMGNFDALGFDYLQFPVHPLWVGTQISCQLETIYEGSVDVNFITSDGLPLFIDTSNLARITFQAPNTFAEAVGQKASTSYRSYVPTLHYYYNSPQMIIGGSPGGYQEYTPWDQNSKDLPKYFDPRAFSASAAPWGDGATILTTGGSQGSPFTDASKSAYLTIPWTKSSYPIPDMIQGRAGHLAVTDYQGQVFILGGITDIDSSISHPTSDSADYHINALLDTTEIYNSNANTFISGPRMPEPIAFAKALFIGGGEYLIAGGITTDDTGHFKLSNHVWVFNVEILEFSGPYLMNQPRMLPEMTLTIDGHIYITGGLTDHGEYAHTHPASFLNVVLSAMDGTEYGLTNNSLTWFQSGPTLFYPRVFHNSFDSGDGSLLTAGGYTGSLLLTDMPYMNTTGSGGPITGTVSSEFINMSILSHWDGPNLVHPRFGASWVKSFMDLRILIIGGGADVVEMYQPYAFH